MSIYIPNSQGARVHESKFSLENNKEKEKKRAEKKREKQLNQDEIGIHANSHDQM